MAKGRPRKEIDKAQFEKLCGLQCTLTEIAGFFDCSEDTIESWAKRTYKVTFSEAFKTYSAPGKISLRRYQFKMAEHNAAMAIWLGKQWLNQTDHVLVEDHTALERLDEILKGTRENAAKIQRQAE